MTCPSCSRRIEQGRADLGLALCLSCAQTRPVTRYRGAMIYGHKTAGAVHLMAPDEFSRYKKLSNRRGQSSVLRNVLEANGRAL
jgi:hypothetical protein